MLVKMMEKSKKRVLMEWTIIFVSLVVSFALGLIFHDYILGSLTLFFGFMNSYYMAVGKWQNYIFGILFTITYTIICTINGLYGWLIFSIVFYVPVQIYGLVNWSKNQQNKEVKMKSFTWKNSLIICTLVIVGSGILGFLLSLIPSQRLAFLDSTSQIINICGVVLVAIRFRECWYVWLINNLIDLSIWIVNVIHATENAEMTLITSIMYLIMNVIGLISWIVIENRQKKMGNNMDKICQSCGMPLHNEDDYGTEKNGNKSKDYCKYCYKDGDFIDKVGMEEYIDMCSQYGAQAGMSNEEMRIFCINLFPKLKRWKKDK